MTRAINLKLSTIQRLADYDPDVVDKVINDGLTALDNKQEKEVMKKEKKRGRDRMAYSKLTHANINGVSYPYRDWVDALLRMIELAAKDNDMHEINRKFGLASKLRAGKPKIKGYKYISQLNATLPTMQASKYADALKTGGNRIGYTFRFDYEIRSKNETGTIESEVPLSKTGKAAKQARTRS